MITACWGTNSDKTVEFAASHGAKIVADPMTMMDQKIADVIYIVVPPFAHDGSWELAAVDAGMPFLCEKPVALDLGIARRVADAVDEAGLVTASGFLLRAGETSMMVREVVSRNDISLARSCRFQGPGGKGWHGQMERSGGPMVEAGIHHVDFMRFLFGEVREVSATTTAGINLSRADGWDIYDSMSARLCFEGGVVADVAVSAVLDEQTGMIGFLDVVGREFLLTYESPWDGGVVRYKEGGGDWVELVNDKGRLDLHNQCFLEAARYCEPGMVRGTYCDAVRSLEVVLAMNRSAERDEPVRLPMGSPLGSDS